MFFVVLGFLLLCVLLFVFVDVLCCLVVFVVVDVLFAFFILMRVALACLIVSVFGLCLVWCVLLCF